MTPAETVSKAAAKVTRLEAALAALDDSDDADGAEATALKEALKKARAQAALSNSGRRVDECQQYVARAARLLDKAKAVLAEAQQQGLPIWKLCAKKHLVSHRRKFQGTVQS